MKQRIRRDFTKIVVEIRPDWYLYVAEL